MRILMVHKYFRRQGVSTGYMFDLSKVMTDKGNVVIHFSMQDERNEPSPYSSYFVSRVDFNEPMSVPQKIRALVRSFYSLEARRKIERLIKDARPEVAFLHPVAHHITPSILHSLRKCDIPVLMHVQDYFLVCPSYRLLVGREICERCKGGRFYNAAIQKCVKASRARSFAVTCFAYVHKWLRTYEDNVDYFICPSRFMLNKLVEFGFPSERLVHIPQAVSLEGRRPRYDFDEYIVFFGWLRPEKGVATLLRSLSLLPKVRLLVVGDGEERKSLEQLAQVESIAGRVVFTDSKTANDLQETVRNATMAIVPSEWYEVYGMVAYEAFALGKPVIASRIGGLPELVRDGETGLLFERGNPEDLAAKVQHLLERPALICHMGRNARKMVETELSADRNYEAIMALYDGLLQRG